MELEFTPDQDELRDSIRAVLAQGEPGSLARAVVENGDAARTRCGRRWSSSAGPR